MSTDQTQTAQLPKEVADKYELRHIIAGTYDFGSYGVIDLTKISLSRAKQLVNGGFPYLVAIEKTTTPAKAKIAGTE